MAQKPLEKNQDNPQFLSRRALARRWGVSIMTVRRRESDGTLRRYLLAGRDIRFRVSDVEAVEAAALVA